MPRRMVARYARRGRRARPGAARLYLAAARRRPAAGAARRRQHLGQDRAAATCSASEVEVLCVKGSGWDMAAIEPAGLPAVRLAPLRKLRARDGALRRGHGARPARQPARPRRAQPVGRDAAARLPAAQIHRPHAFDRGAEPRRPARRRRALRRSLRPADGARALHHAGLRARQEGGGSLRGRPRGRGAGAAEARHLHLRRHRARGLRADDRDGHARRGAARARPQDACSPPRALPQRSPAPAEVAPILRGACAMPDPAGAGAYKRFVLDFRGEPGGPRFRQRRRAARATARPASRPPTTRSAPRTTR